MSTKHHTTWYGSLVEVHESKFTHREDLEEFARELMAAATMLPHTDAFKAQIAQLTKAS